MKIKIGRDPFKRAGAVEYKGAKPRSMRARTHNGHIALVPLPLEISPRLGPPGSECHVFSPYAPSIVSYPHQRRVGDFQDLFCTARVTENGLQLKKFFQPGLTPLAAVTRLLETAKATAEVDSGAIDMHVAGANSFGDPVRSVDVSRGYEARQTVWRVIRNSNGIIFGLVRDDA